VNATDARRLAERLIRQHLTDNGHRGWTFVWGRGKRTLGTCNYAARTITLSRPFAQLNAEAEVLDTILHEIAHALTPGAKHGAAWKAACVRLGARPNRTASLQQVVVPPSKYALVCPCCGARSGRERRTTRRYYCGPCYQRGERHVLDFVRDA